MTRMATRWPAASPGSRSSPSWSKLSSGRTTSRINWNNLPFDLRHRQTVAEPEGGEAVHKEQVSGDEQEENLDRYIHEEEEEASEAVTMESVVQVKHSLSCIVIWNIIFRKTQSWGPGIRIWRRRWRTWGSRWEPFRWPRVWGSRPSPTSTKFLFVYELWNPWWSFKDWWQWNEWNWIQLVYKEKSLDNLDNNNNVENN